MIWVQSPASEMAMIELILEWSNQNSDWTDFLKFAAISFSSWYYVLSLRASYVHFAAKASHKNRNKTNITYFLPSLLLISLSLLSKFVACGIEHMFSVYFCLEFASSQTLSFVQKNRIGTSGRTLYLCSALSRHHFQSIASKHWAQPLPF